MRKKSFLSAIPFLLVLAFLVSSVLISHRSRAKNILNVNTMADSKGEFHSVRVFDSISSVVAVDRDNHARKKEILPSQYSYDRATTRLTFSEPLPFSDAVIHIEGKIAEPEQFFLHDFAESSKDLLVILGERLAIEEYEYTFDEKTRLLTFRSDIHPETDGNFHIAYESEDGSHHSFGNWKEKELDTLSELQWQWLHKTKGVPMFVMKQRQNQSDRELSKEVGFSVSLPKAKSKRDGTFLVETMEENEKCLHIQRWFDEEGLMIECSANDFGLPERLESEEEIEIGKLRVKKQRILGTQTDSLEKEPTDIPLVQYRWEKDGTFYELVARETQIRSAERLLERAR